MFSPQPHRSMVRLLVLAIALILCKSGSHLASGQGFTENRPTQISRADRAPDPTAYPKGVTNKRPVNHARQTPSNLPQPAPLSAPLDKHQQAIEDAISQGNDSRGENDYDHALDYYQKAQTLNPKEARAFYGMGNVYAELYCYDSTIEAYRKALEFKKDYLDALIGLGYAYAGKERYDEAEKQFKKALDLKRDNVDANVGLGRIYLAKGKYQEAITQLNLVINSASVATKDRAAALVALGDVYWKQEKRQDSIAQFKEAIHLQPDLAFAYIELGNAQASIAYSKLGGFTSVNEVNMQDLEALRASEKEAVANLEDARKYHYNHPNLHEFTAIALAYQFRYEDALSELKDYFTEVEKLDARISHQATKCGDGFNRLKADGYYYQGMVYHLEGYFEPDAQRKNEFSDKALDQFNQAIKAKQDFAAAYWMSGMIYDNQKKHEEAISQLKKAVLFSTEEPIRASIYQSIGLAYSMMSHYNDAISNVQEAIKRNPNNPSFYESLADVYVGQGKLEEGLSALKKANALRVELKIEQDANPSAYYYLGVTYTIRFMQTKNEEDFNEAIKALKEAVKIRPKFAFPYQALGVAYESHANGDEALANYKKAAECDPKNPQYYLGMANVYSSLKNNDDAAIGFLKQAIGLKQDYAEAYRRLGKVYYHKKDDAEAVKQFLDAIKYDPKSLQSYLDLAYIYRVQKNYPAALKYLTTAIEIAPTNPKPYQQMGLFYQERSNADEALANFSKAIEYDSKNSVHYVNLAGVYLELKHDNEAAIKQLLKAIEIDPKNLDAYSTLGDIYRGQKNYSEAIKYLTTGIKNVPTVPWTYKDLAKVYEAQGKNDEAIHYYEEAIKHLTADDASVKNLYLGRIARLKGRYAEAIEYFHQVNFPDGPAQAYFDIGVTYVVAKNKKAALGQHQQLVQIKSTLAEELLKKINEMK